MMTADSGQLVPVLFDPKRIWEDEAEAGDDVELDWIISSTFNISLTS